MNLRPLGYEPRRPTWSPPVSRACRYPFSLSAIGTFFVVSVPTAEQKPSARQATAARSMLSALGAVLCSAQAVPFHCSARPEVEPAEVNAPTAMQSDPLMQEIPFRALLVVPAWTGVAWTAQLVPFQCSASAALPLDELWYPTASQDEVEVQEIA